MAWKRSGVQFPLAPLRTLSELVFLDMARKTEMPTETGHGNSAEIHFLPTTSEFLFNSASRAQVLYTAAPSSILGAAAMLISSAAALHGASLTPLPCRP